VIKLNQEINIEYLLGSRNKVRLLKFILSNEEVPMSLIRKKINMKYNHLKQFLKELVKAGILQEFDVGITKIYKVNPSNKRVKALKELFGI